MRSRLAAAVLVVAFLLAAAPVFAGPSAATAEDGGETAAVENLTRSNPAVVFRINVTPDGDARWSVVSRYDLEEGEYSAFRTLAADVREREEPAAGLGYTAETFRTFVDRAEAATDREAPMAVENATWTNRTHNGTGELVLSFTWTNFARQDGDRIELGDVFRDPDGGTWFPSLVGDQRLVINAPSNHGIRTSPFPFEDGSIRVDGPTRLGAEDMSIVFVSPSSPPPPTRTPEPPGGDDTPSAFVAGLVLAVAAAAVIGSYVAVSRSRRSVEDDAPPSDGGDDGELDAPPAATNDPLAGEREADAPDEEDPDIDEELLSDEERVERLLHENGGRMKQSTIVSETGWSSAKVSQLLSSMDEEERVDKLRIGRENLIALPDEDLGEIE